MGRQPLRPLRHRRWPPVGWLLVLLLPGTVLAQPPRADEYALKAAFLFNFLKYVEWPPAAAGGSLEVCVAGQNPFGPVFFEIMRGETVKGRPVEAREILSPDPACDVVFIPRTANIGAYLRAARDTPTLLVGETRDFLEQGGTINFVEDGSRLRFAIAVERAQRAGLRIDASLLRLRVVAETGAPR